MPKILLVDDDVNFSRKLREFLEFDKHVVDLAHNGEDGWQFLKSYKYDVVILDWNMPGMTGVELCKKFRANEGMTPVLMLTGKDGIDDKETGFESGADDYLTKPFNARELVARIRALTRRPTNIYADKINLCGLALDSAAVRVEKNGREIQLQPKEFALLEFLMRNPNKVFGAKLLLERLWNADTEASEDTIRTYMKTLRRKIAPGDEVCPIRTVHGLGYKFEAEV
ncbi:MAG TPA: response regulator transcription factor [Chroococcales cyanobacterium]